MIIGNDVRASQEFSGRPEHTLGFGPWARRRSFIPVIDKEKQQEGLFTREDVIYDEMRDLHVCPVGAELTTTGHVRGHGMIGYLASVNDCRSCPLKARCCPKTPQGKVTRHVHEFAREIARDLSTRAIGSQQGLAANTKRFRVTGKPSTAISATKSARSRLS